MVDPSAVERFQWDDGNIRKSADWHGVSPKEAEQVFANEPLLTTTDERHSEQERRFAAMGHTDNGRRLFLSFTLPDADRAIRVISARDMSRKERIVYEAET